MHRFVITVISAALLSVIGYSQDKMDTVKESPSVTTLQHIVFKGVPVTGTPSEFAAKLYGAGFRDSSRKEQGCQCFTGDFFGVRDCDVLVHAKDNFVWKVTVCFPPSRMWMNVKEQYASLKQGLTEKYEVEPQSEEKLSARYKEGSGLEQWGFESRYSKWRSLYVVPGGTIALYVDFEPVTQCVQTRINYIDSVNYYIKRELEKDDI